MSGVAVANLEDMVMALRGVHKYNDSPVGVFNRVAGSANAREHFERGQRGEDVFATHHGRLWPSPAFSDGV
eukprot:11162380-Lingulodinium_polyedra.AAC.1